MDLFTNPDKPDFGDLPPDNLNDNQIVGGNDATEPAYQKVGDTTKEVPRAMAVSLKGPRFDIGTTDLADMAQYSPTEPVNVDELIGSNDDVDAILKKAKPYVDQQAIKNAQQIVDMYNQDPYEAKSHGIDFSTYQNATRIVQNNKNWYQRTLDALKSPTAWDNLKKSVSQAGSDISKSWNAFLEDTDKHGTQQFKNIGKLGVGLGTGVAELAPSALDFASQQGQIIGTPYARLFGKDVEQQYEATLNATAGAAHAWTNKFAKELKSELGIDSGDFMTGVGENAAPFVVGAPGLEALSAKAEEIASNYPKYIASIQAKAYRGLAKTAEPAGVAAGVGSKAVAGMAIGEMVGHGRIGALLYPLLSRGRTAIQDFTENFIKTKFGDLASDATAIAKSKQGQSAIEALIEASDLSAVDEAVITKSMKEGLSEVDKIALEKKLPSGAPWYSKDSTILSDEAKAFLKQQKRLEDIQAKIAYLRKNLRVSRGIESINKYLVSSALKVGEASAIGGLWTAAGAPVGDRDSWLQGAALGAGIGAVAGIAKAPFAFRQAYLESNRAELHDVARQYLGQYGDISYLNKFPEQVRSDLLSQVGTLASTGTQVEILDPADFSKKALGEESSPEHQKDLPPGVYDESSDTVLLNKEKIGYGVESHEGFHSTAINDALQFKSKKYYQDLLSRFQNPKTSQDAIAISNFKRKYKEQLSNHDPDRADNMSDKEFADEATAEYARLISQSMPSEYFYGGKGMAAHFYDWLHRAANFIDPNRDDKITTVPGFDAPARPSDIQAIKDVQYERGKLAAENKNEILKPKEEPAPPVEESKPAEPAPEQPLEPEQPPAEEKPAEPVVADQEISDARQALRGMGVLVRDIDPKMEAGVEEAKNGNLPIKAADLVNYYFHGDFNDPNTGKLPDHLKASPAKEAPPEEPPAQELFTPPKKAKLAEVGADASLGELVNHRLKLHENVMTKQETAALKKAVADGEIIDKASLDKYIKNRKKGRTDLLKALKSLQDNRKPFRIRFIKTDGRQTSRNVQFGVRPAVSGASRGRPSTDPNLYKMLDLGGKKSDRHYITVKADRIIGIDQSEKLGGVKYGNRNRKFMPSTEEGDINAIQEQKTGEVLQREPQKAGEAGSGRGRVEQGQQGEETTNAGQKENKKEEVIPPRLERESKNLGLAHIGSTEKHDVFLDPLSKETIKIKKNAEPGTLVKKLSDITLRNNVPDKMAFMPDSEHRNNKDIIKGMGVSNSIPAIKRAIEKIGGRLEEGAGELLVWAPPGYRFFATESVAVPYEYYAHGSKREAIAKAASDIGQGFYKDKMAFMPNTAEPFYSQLERTIQDQPDKSSPEQLRAALAKGKQQELKDTKDTLGTSFEQWLKDNPKASKQDMLDFVNENKVKIGEFNRGSQWKYSSEMKTYLAPHEVPSTSEDWQRLSYKLESLGRQRQINGDADERSKRYFDLSEEAARLSEGIDTTTGSTNGMPRFNRESLNLPGGKPGTYGETSVTVPSKERTFKIEKKYGAYRRYQVVNSVTGELMGEYYNKSDANTALAYQERTIGQNWIGSHTGVDNEILHIRHDLRDLPDGQKGFMLQELQSDYNQAVRKRGYKSNALPEGSIVSQDKNGLWDASSPEGISVSGRETEEMARRDLLSISNEGKVPDLPFKGNAWKRLGLKVAIKKAVESGANKLLWTTGEQQADRYNLSKHLDRVDAAKTNDGRYSIRAVDKNGDIESYGQYTSDELPGVVGKDLTDKIVNQVTDSAKSFTGLDLKVGGEWAKNLYDKDVPNTLNDIVKKWGVKAGYQNISFGDEYRVYKDSHSGLFGIEAYTPEARTWDVFIDDQMSSKQEADNMLEQIYKDHELSPFQMVHSLDITPEMAHEISTHGQPLFMPSTHPDAIKSAAIRLNDGKIFTGVYHGEAFRKAMQEVPDANKVFRTSEQGFVTNKGDFLNRNDANQRAKELGQIPKESADTRTMRGLEANQFEKDRQFMPNPQTETPEFKKWFGDSKVRDEQGNPLVVYHGSKQEFNQFNTISSHIGSHFSESNDVGNMYSKDPGGVVYPVYLSIKHPLEIRDLGRWTWADLLQELQHKGIIEDWKKDIPFFDRSNFPNEKANQRIQEYLKAKGYDGISYINRYEVLKPGESALPGSRFYDLVGMYGKSISDSDFKKKFPFANKSYIAFDPSQIKSATGNTGAFDASNPDIRFMPSSNAAHKLSDGIKDSTDASMVRDAVTDWEKRNQAGEDARKNADSTRKAWQKQLSDMKPFFDLANKLRNQNLPNTPELNAEYKKLDNARIAMDADETAIAQSYDPIKGVYIRFGDIPEGGISKRHYGTNDTVNESGLSVYEVKIDKNSGKWQIVDNNGNAGLTIDGLLQDRNRKIQLVSGDEVGTGGDGEPVIKNSRILKQLRTEDIVPPETSYEQWMQELGNGKPWDYKFMPSTHPDAIDKAAVRFPDGKIYTGWMHPDAWATGIHNYSVDQIIKWQKELGDNYAERGYTNNKGAFVTPEQAEIDAKRVGQVTQSGLDKARERLSPKNQDLGKPRGLEALQFNEAKRFMPSLDSFDDISKQIENAIANKKDWAIDIVRSPKDTKYRSGDKLRFSVYQGLRGDGEGGSIPHTSFQVDALTNSFGNKNFDANVNKTYENKEAFIAAIRRYRAAEIKAAAPELETEPVRSENPTVRRNKKLSEL